VDGCYFKSIGPWSSTSSLVLSARRRRALDCNASISACNLAYEKRVFRAVNLGTEKENHVPFSLLFQSLKKWNRDFFEVELLYYYLKEGKTEEVIIESYGKFISLRHTIGSLTENVVHPIMIILVTGNRQSSRRYLIDFICIQRI
jgi:hypothetical protein